MYMSHIKAAASLIQDLNCGRCSHTKIINGGKFLSSVQSLFSRFFTESAKENFDIMDNDFKERLSRYVSPENLPIEYGGTLPTLKWAMSRMNSIFWHCQFSQLTNLSPRLISCKNIILTCNPKIKWNKRKRLPIENGTFINYSSNYFGVCNTVIFYF